MADDLLQFLGKNCTSVVDGYLGSNFDKCMRELDFHRYNYGMCHERMMDYIDYVEESHELYDMQFEEVIKYMRANFIRFPTKIRDVIRHYIKKYGKDYWRCKTCHSDKICHCFDNLDF